MRGMVVCGVVVGDVVMHCRSVAMMDRGAVSMRHPAADVQTAAAGFSTIGQSCQ